MKQRLEPVDQRLFKALAHPLRVQILQILCQRVASPQSICEEIGADLTHVAYHARTLTRCGCLELVGTAQRRGATEHFYRALPGASALHSYLDVALAAFEAEAIDGRAGSALAWRPLRVDRRGSEEVQVILEEATAGVLDAEARSARRLRGKDSAAELSTIFAAVNFVTAGSRRPA